MKTLVLSFGAFCLAAAPALAQTATVTPAEAKAHVGQTMTVEGAVSDVHTVATGVTFIDLGGHYPDNAFTAVIFAANAGKFPNVSALNGKTVDITGPVQLYKGTPEILLNDAAQIKTK